MFLVIDSLLPQSSTIEECIDTNHLLGNMFVPWFSGFLILSSLKLPYSNFLSLSC